MRIGADLVQISRIKHLPDPEAFAEKILCSEEKEYYRKKGQRPQTLAGIFAVKEAAVKCLGKGLGHYAFKEIHLFHDEEGSPELVFEGKAEAYLKRAGLSSMAVTLSHDGDYAMAICLGIPFSGRKEGPFIPMDRLCLDLHPLLLKREKNGHKGTFGKVALIGGSFGMAGSICLSSQAALRAGSGLSYAIVPAKIGEICQIKLSEVMVRPIGRSGEERFTSSMGEELLERIEDVDAIGIGPGMGKDPTAADFLCTLFEHVDKPMVIDADAINALSNHPEYLKKGKAFKLLTPHEMEMSRISGLPLEEIRKDRKKAAADFAEKYELGLILKGRGTVAAEGGRIWVNPSGNSGMATAGAGDVLTGILTALLGRGYDFWTAMRLGPYLHGLAGDLAALDRGEESLIAGDILEKIPEAFQLMESL